MSKAMYQNLFYSILVIFLFVSCSKKNIEINNIPPDKSQSFKIYEEAVKEMNEGNYFLASK